LTGGMAGGAASHERKSRPLPLRARTALPRARLRFLRGQRKGRLFPPHFCTLAKNWRAMGSR